MAFSASGFCAKRCQRDSRVYGAAYSSRGKSSLATALAGSVRAPLSSHPPERASRLASAAADILPAGGLAAIRGDSPYSGRWASGVDVRHLLEM